MFYTVSNLFCSFILFYFECFLYYFSFSYLHFFQTDQTKKRKKCKSPQIFFGKRPSTIITKNHELSFYRLSCTIQTHLTKSLLKSRCCQSKQEEQQQQCDIKKSNKKTIFCVCFAHIVIIYYLHFCSVDINKMRIFCPLKCLFKVDVIPNVCLYPSRRQ